MDLLKYDLFYPPTRRSRFVSTPGTRTFCIRQAASSFSSSGRVARKNNIERMPDRKPLSCLAVACKISSTRKVSGASARSKFGANSATHRRDLPPPLRRLYPNGTDIVSNIIPSAKTRGNRFSPLPGALTYPTTPELRAVNHPGRK